MGLFDNLAGMAGNLDLGGIAGNPQVAELAAKVGITPEQVQQVLALLPQAAAQPGDTAENAANASGLPLDRVRELLAQMGTGDGPLAGLGKLFG
jgi:hypothetical protein